MYVNRLIIVGKLHKEAKFDGGLATIGIEHDGLMMRVVVDDRMLMSSIQDDLKVGCTVVVEGRLGMEGRSIVAMVSTERSDNLRVILDSHGKPVVERRLADLAANRTYDEDRSQRQGEVDPEHEDLGREESAIGDATTRPPEVPRTPEPTRPTDAAPPLEGRHLHAVAREGHEDHSTQQTSAAPSSPPRQSLPGRPIAAPARPPTPGRPLPLAAPEGNTGGSGSADHRPPPRQYVVPPSQQQGAGAQNGSRPLPTSIGKLADDDDIPF